jgi:hypothetical protein
LRYGAPYVDLAKQCEQDKKKRSYKQLLGEDAEPVLAIDPRTHRAHYLVPTTAAAKILEKNHSIKIQVASSSTASRSSRGNSWEKREAARKLRRKDTLAWLIPACNEAAELLVGKVEKLNNKLNDLHARTTLYRVLCAQNNNELYATEEMVKRRGWKNSSSAVFEAAVEQMSFAQLAGLSFEMIFWTGFNDYHAQLEKESIHELQGFGIDWDEIAAKHRAAAAPPASPKGKAKAAGAK